MTAVNSFPLETTPFATALQTINLALYKATSTSSLAIGAGNKVFTTQEGKDFVAGDFVLASSDADPSTDYMSGVVVSYVDDTLTVDVLCIGGSGTHADWTIRASGPPGERGESGPAAWAAPVAWQTATAFTATAPASVVTEGGETYVCLISHTSGVFATDLAASRWIKVAAKGADGEGTGDVVGPSSSVDGEVALFDSTTGKLLKRATGSGIAKITSGVLGVAGTGDTLTIGTVELGHASDTTLSRASAGVIAVEGVNLTPNVPISSKSAAYTTTLADANTALYHPSSDNNARTFTINSNANVPYPVGTCLTFINEINTVTISITSDTLTMAGTGSTGSRSLAANGIATATKVTSTKWVISGVGLT